MDIIKKWQTYLNLNDWNIITNPINDEQVLYDDDCPISDRYFVGVEYDLAEKEAVIHHGRQLMDDDVIHELLHVKYPKWTEDDVNEETDRIINEIEDDE